MELNIPVWLFTTLPLALFVAALFWGAPIIALLSELSCILTGRPFPARCAQQMNSLALKSHVTVWLALLIGAGFLWQNPFWSSEFVRAHQLSLILTAALPFCGTLLLFAYNFSWKNAKNQRGLHFAIGCLANIPLKYGYWGAVILGLVFLRGLPLESPAFIPPLSSPLWPFFGLWVPTSLNLAAALGLCYLLIRRSKDDWGRDYYRFAAPFLAKWLLITALLCLLMQGWLYLSLKTTMNLQLPQIIIPGAANMVCLVLSMLLSIFIIINEHPMRLKGSMIGIALLAYLQMALFIGATFETINHYVAGWSLPTFIPSLLPLLPL